MGFLKRKTKGGTFMAKRWGKRQQSTHSTRPAANTVNLSVPSSLYMHGTHTRPAWHSCVWKCVWSYLRGWSVPSRSPVGGGPVSRVYVGGGILALDECWGKVRVNIYSSRKCLQSVALLSSDVLTRVETCIHVRSQTASNPRRFGSVCFFYPLKPEFVSEEDNSSYVCIQLRN